MALLRGHLVGNLFLDILVKGLVFRFFACSSVGERPATLHASSWAELPATHIVLGRRTVRSLV